MYKILNTFLLLVFIFLYSCDSLQSVKRGLTGEKVESSDEFLVKKKDPLVVPPNFEKMPNPKMNELYEEEDEIENILSIEKNTQDDVLSSQGSVEENILKRIKKK